MSARIFWVLAGGLLAMPALLCRCRFLAPTWLGPLFYYTNVLKDSFQRRFALPRALGDVPLLLLSLAILAASGPWGATIALGSLALVASLELSVRGKEREVLGASWMQEDPRWRRPERDCVTPLPAGVGAHPSPHPALTLSLAGPFVSRRPVHSLGSLARGRTAHVEVLVGNHTRAPSQTPPTLKIEVEGGAAAQQVANPQFVPLRAGGVSRWRIAVSAPSGLGGKVSLTVSCGCWKGSLVIDVEAAPSDESLASAETTRYPGGCRAAFAWRGDMDHYDTATFQSIEGLKATLGLAARYRVPQTMYLSTRLTLDMKEAVAFYDHFGVQRGAEEIPDFVEWMKREVDLRHVASYPFESAKPYLMEVGNHMHLHYGTDASASPENGWRRAAGIGAGEYSWATPGGGSFEEQRDNALEARKRIEKAFGFSPKSWAMPDSTRDGETPRAVQAAGCEVTSDADGRHVDNVLFQPGPHLAEGSTAIELTKRYPGDPESLISADMIRYWMHRAWRRRIPVVFMCHQHMRQFAGEACTRFTEYILRSALSEFNGDLHVNTVYGIGSYWKAVLSRECRTVAVRVEGGEVRVENGSDLELSALPVDLVFRSGERATVLVDLAPGEMATIPVCGEVRKSR